MSDGTSVIVAFDYETNQPENVPEPIRTAISEFEGKLL